jgi:hypothetical protein
VSRWSGSTLPTVGSGSPPPWRARAALPRAGGRDEPVEDGQRVERTRAALGVVLDRFDRQRAVAQPLHRSVVEVDLADDEAARLRQRVGDDRDLVVLGRDLDQARLEVLDRVVRGVVAEGQAPRVRPAARPMIWWPRQMPSSGRPSAMTGGRAPRGRPAGPGRRVRARRRRRRRPAPAPRRRGRVRQDPHARAAPAKAAHDVRLEAEVEDRDERAALGRIALVARGRGRDLGHEILVLPAGHGAGQRASFLRVGLPGAVTMARRSRSIGGAGPGLACRRRRSPGCPPRAASSPAAGVVENGGRGVGHDQAAQPGPLGLVVVSDAAVVADERVRHDDELAGVAGIGGDLLVAGLAGVHDEVALAGALRAEGDAGEHAAVLERQQRRAVVTDPRVDDGAGARKTAAGRQGGRRP